MPQAIGSLGERTQFLFGDGHTSTIPDDPFANQEAVYCRGCGGRFCPRSDTGFYCQEHRQWSCRNCGPCGTGHDYGDANEFCVHEWNYHPRHYRPKGNWRATDGFYREPLMGVELEVGGRASSISPVVLDMDRAADHLYMKQDGSISGVEIVTHPMTLAWAREYPFPKLLKKLRRAHCRVDDGYGLHIHVSRNAFTVKGKQSSTHQMLWLLFLYRNSGKLEMLARRSANRYASWQKPRAGELARKAKYVGDCCSDSRYVAVNCNNIKTFELRFFKSTLDEREFYAALEFADASVRYTRDIRTREVLRGRALTWPHFVEWVGRHNYKQLAAELAVREAAAAAARRLAHETRKRFLALRRLREEEAAREAVDVVGGGGGVAASRPDLARGGAVAGTYFGRYFDDWYGAARAGAQVTAETGMPTYINCTSDGRWFLTLDPEAYGAEPPPVVTYGISPA